MGYIRIHAILALVVLTHARAVTGAEAPVKDREASPTDAVWVEGEHPTRKNVNTHNWYNSVKTDALSGGQWISHFSGQNKVGTAEYEFEIIEPDTFTFWLRANPVKSSLSYRLDGGAWTPVDFTDKREQMNIARDHKPDLRFIAWVRVGAFELKKGKHVAAFRMDSKLQSHGAVDCFTFVRVPFAPSGGRRPTVRAGQAGPDDWFPVVFDDDPFSEESVIDMSRLVEAPAGTRGFLKRDGDRLRFEKADQPVKFWGVGANVGAKKPADMRQAARWFRKHGINLVRQHTVIGDVGLLNERGAFDADKLDRYDRWFAELKQQGIYTTWSVIYPHHGAFLRKQDGYDPARFAELDALDAHRDGDKGPIVVNDFINLDRDLQDIAWRYFEKLLTHRNPYTGLAYKDDPALAVLEYQNESNLFFHTLNGLSRDQPPTFARIMRQRFFEFVKKKYKSREAVAEAWNNRWMKRDNWSEGELALMGAHHWGSEGPQYEYKGHVRRTGDYIEFITGIQYGYFKRREQQVREAGFKAVTVTTAWRAGGPAASLANLACDTAADMIDRHNYIGGGAGRHVIQTGKVNNLTHLDQPGHGLLNLALFQVKGRPFGVSEWSMTPPAQYKAEAAPIVAFYGLGLQGWDASYHFNCKAVRMGNGWPNLSKYVTHTPHYMGQFPALAFAVHHGHIREGEIVAERMIGRNELFAGKDVLGQALAGGGHDDKRLVGRLSTPPETVAIGRVLVTFGEGPSHQTREDRYRDRDRKILTSTTGELLWHYGDRYIEVRSPKTQAVIGFPPEEAIRLPGVTADVGTSFVSLIFTPLDNADLADSRHILITAMARDQQTDTQYNEDGSRLLQLGRPPLLMEPVKATIRLDGRLPGEVKVLDVYGVPTGKNVPFSPDGTFSINGTYATYYYEVKR